MTNKFNELYESTISESSKYQVKVPLDGLANSRWGSALEMKAKALATSARLKVTEFSFKDQTMELEGDESGFVKFYGFMKNSMKMTKLGKTSTSSSTSSEFKLIKEVYF